MIKQLLCRILAFQLIESAVVFWLKPVQRSPCNGDRAKVAKAPMGKGFNALNLIKKQDR
jgi:hypothetical protein